MQKIKKKLNYQQLRLSDNYLHSSQEEHEKQDKKQEEQEEHEEQDKKIIWSR